VARGWFQCNSGWALWKENKMSYKAVALTFGYAEDSTSATIIFTPEYVFETKKEALHSLVEYLYTKYLVEIKHTDHHKNEYKTHMAECCRKAWNKKGDCSLERCPKCGASYAPVKSPFDIGDWESYLLEIFRSTADSYGDFEVGVSCNWNPWDFDFSITNKQMVIIAEKGELVLTKTLFKIHPELLEELEEDIDDFGAYNKICSE
jgi:hypothetical protein